MTVTVPIPAPEVPARVWAKVRKTEHCWHWTAAKNIGGYGVFRLNRRVAIAHRFIYEALREPIPAGQVMDHMCHNPGCVNPDHLRPTTDKQNGENRGRLNANNASGVRGVHWRKDIGKWEARATHRRKVHVAGQFTALQEAEAAVVALRLELFTHNDLDHMPVNTEGESCNAK